MLSTLEQPTGWAATATSCWFFLSIYSFSMRLLKTFLALHWADFKQIGRRTSGSYSDKWKKVSKDTRKHLQTGFSLQDQLLTNRRTLLLWLQDLKSLTTALRQTHVAVDFSFVYIWSTYWRKFKCTNLSNKCVRYLQLSLCVSGFKPTQTHWRMFQCTELMTASNKFIHLDTSNSPCRSVALNPVWMQLK